MKSKPSPLVSIVILNLNGINDTEECIDSVLNSEYSNYEIILIDNGSRVDETIEIMKKYQNKVRTYRFSINQGFAGGNNRAIRYCKGKYVVLLNNDTVVDPSWLNKPVEVFERYSNIGVAQPKIRSYYSRKTFDYAGACGGYLDKYGYPFTRGRIFKHQEIDSGQYDNPSEIFWASGAALMFKKNILRQTEGLFDPIFFNYMEEIDFCWRVWRSGYKVISIPEAVVYHKVAGTSKSNIVKKRYWEHRNNLLLLYKNLSHNDIIRIVGIRSMFEIMNYFHYLFTFQCKCLLALSFAHLSVIFYIPRLKKSKQRNQNEPPIFTRSVVVEYFLKGKKKFSILNWSRNKGERSVTGNDYLIPTFLQHLFVYKYAKKFAKNKMVMDIGCGNGYGAKELSQRAQIVVATDKDIDTINFARVNNYAYNIDYRTEAPDDRGHFRQYDLTTSFQVIEHVNNINEFLDRTSSFLRKGGIGLFSTPNSTTQSYNENPYHIKEYNSNELEPILSKYYRSTSIKGLSGSKRVLVYESSRKASVTKIMKLDLLNIRKIIPVRIKKIIFESLIPVARKKISIQEIKIYDYKITTNTTNCIDLIAICKK